MDFSLLSSSKWLQYNNKKVGKVKIEVWFLQLPLLKRAIYLLELKKIATMQLSNSLKFPDKLKQQAVLDILEASRRRKGKLIASIKDVAKFLKLRSWTRCKTLFLTSRRLLTRKISKLCLYHQELWSRHQTQLRSNIHLKCLSTLNSSTLVQL